MQPRITIHPVGRFGNAGRGIGTELGGGIVLGGPIIARQQMQAGVAARESRHRIAGIAEDHPADAMQIDEFAQDCRPGRRISGGVDRLQQGGHGGAIMAGGLVQQLAVGRRELAVVHQFAGDGRHRAVGGRLLEKFAEIGIAFRI